MQVQVKYVHEQTSQRALVDIRSPFGDCQATWVGTIPGEGQYYHVEIDIPELLIWGNHVRLCQRKNFSLQNFAHGVHLVGKLVSAEDDGCTTLQFGESTILLETLGTPPADACFIEVTAQTVLLYNAYL